MVAAAASAARRGSGGGGGGGAGQPPAAALCSSSPSTTTRTITSSSSRRHRRRRNTVLPGIGRGGAPLGSPPLLALASALLLLLLPAAVAADGAPPRFGSVIAPAEGFSLPRAALPELPLWVRNRTADVILDFSKADPRYAFDWRYKPTPGGRPGEQTAHVPFRGKDMPVLFPLGHFHGNVAVVRFGARLVAAVRKMYFFKTTREQIEGYPKAPPEKKGHDALISWWGSSVSVCDLDSRTMQPLACADFDPRPWSECLWSQGFEGTGVEDPRLIVWPGKGLYVMFGSKPWPVDPGAAPPTAESTACDGPWAFQQFLMLLQPYADKPDPSDPWAKGIVRLNYLADGKLPEPGPDGAPPPLLKEKNWNAFIYKGRLLFSQTFDPHVVVEPYPNGTCVRVFETRTRAFRALPSSPRGNTQAVLVPAAFSGERRDYYLGVVHAERGRAYQNYFYKMQAHPPFRIYSVSRAMPIVNGQQPRNPAWTDVSFPMSLDLLQDTAQVLVGYGSGDRTPRVLVMPWEDVRALFASSSSAGGEDGLGLGGGGGGRAAKRRRD